MSDNGSDDEGGFGLGDLMPRSPSPEPAPNSFATYELPEGRALADGRKEIEVRLVGSHPLWGHHLWNTARVTTSYLLKHAATLVEGKRILELGAGGALPSIACSLAGARTVVATDYADDVLMENIAFNATHNLGEGSSVLAVGHTWGHSVAELLDAGITDEDRKAAAPAAAAADDEQGRYDVVILSDLMFNHSQHGALVKTLEATLKTAVGVPTPDPQSPTAAPQTPCALVFLTHHRPWLADADMAFMPRLAKRGWGYERVVEEWTGPMFENDPGEERVRGTVHGFRVWRTGAAFEEDSDED